MSISCSFILFVSDPPPPYAPLAHHKCALRNPAYTATSNQMPACIHRYSTSSVLVHALLRESTVLSTPRWSKFDPNENKTVHDSQNYASKIDRMNLCCQSANSVASARLLQQKQKQIPCLHTKGSVP